MARLFISLLGPLRVTLERAHTVAFKSNKARALLVYLAVEAHQPHRREMLAGLLWPDWPDRDALSNLRYTLSDLRQAIGDRTTDPPFLLVSRDELQFNLASDCSLDVTSLLHAAEGITHPSASLSRLEQAVALYQRPFLDGFSLSDCPSFEQWVLWTRERLDRQVSAMLHHLAAAYEQGGEFDRAQAYAWRQLELEPCDESAHQLLMRTLALSDQRAAALAQYQTCRRLLADELGVEPGAETTRLYEQIREGSLRGPAVPPRPDTATRLPRFLELEPPAFERPVVVRASASWRSWRRSCQRRWPARATSSSSPAKLAAAKPLCFTSSRAARWLNTRHSRWRAASVTPTQAWEIHTHLFARSWACWPATSKRDGRPGLSPEHTPAAYGTRCLASRRP